MKFVPKPMTDITTPKIPDPIVSDISVARLIDDGLLAIHREMKNLLMLGAKGKLDANNARDLRDHLKLLFELKDREGESLRNLTDEELETKAKAALDVKSD
jgi:hypothetical protein